MISVLLHVVMENTEQRGTGIENGWEWWNGRVHLDQTGPIEKSGLKGGLIFSKLFRLDWTDPFSFRLKFPEILVEWNVPLISYGYMGDFWLFDIVMHACIHLYDNLSQNSCIHICAFIPCHRDNSQSEYRKAIVYWWYYTQPSHHAPRISLIGCVDHCIFYGMV